MPVSALTTLCAINVPTTGPASDTMLMTETYQRAPCHVCSDAEISAPVLS